MSPSLSNGDWIIVSPIPYRSNPPQRGDVIVFKRKALTRGHIVKRVIALPGETVEVRQGRVFVDGSPIEDEFYLHNPEDNFGPMVVGDDSCFVMGDNRGFSNDSRHWEKSEVDFEEIFGKMIFDFN